MTLVFTHFANNQKLIYGFSGRRDGSMSRHIEHENRNAYFGKLNIDSNNVVTADLIHGSNVQIVGKEAMGRMIPECDGLVTNTKHVILSVTGADCFILFLYDPANNAVGISHVGWRGLLNGIVKNTVQSFIDSFNTLPKDLCVGISPGIRVCHFEMSVADAIKFKDYPACVLQKDNKPFVDLPAIIKQQLYSLGIVEGRVEDSNMCTYCNEQEYFSYRRDKPKEVQAMLGYIGLL